MNQLQLQEPHLIEQLQQIAEHEQVSVEALLNRAVSEFLGKMARKKLEAETQAFEQMHSELVAQYLGDFVAVHNGAVIDHDPDLRTLHIRIRQRLGKMPVLLRQVTNSPTLPDIVIRSPRLSKIAL